MIYSYQKVLRLQVSVDDSYQKVLRLQISVDDSPGVAKLDALEHLGCEAFHRCSW
jgi:hypothetical protein